MQHLALTVVVVFFFSSRRRHTRLQGDWSFRRVLFRSNPRSAACAATTSAICSHGRGERLITHGSPWWIVLSAQMRKSAPALASLWAEDSISSPTPGQSLRSMHFMYLASEWVCIETSG